MQGSAGHSRGSRWRWALLPVVVSVCGFTLIAWDLRRRYETSGARSPTASVRAAPESPANLSRRGATAEEISSSRNRLAKAPSAEAAGDPAADEEGILRGDSGPVSVIGPTIQELAGWRSRLFGLWRTEPEDQGATKRSMKFLEEALSRHAIHPTAYHVRCSLSLCRTRLRFRSIGELHRMSEIKPPAGVEVATTLPQRIDDELVDLSIYWPQQGLSLEELMRGRAADGGEPWSGP